MKKLFGGSETKSTSTPTDMTPDEYKNLRGPFAETIMSYLQQGGTPQYEGPLKADMTQTEGDILTQLMDQTGAGTGRSSYLSSVLSGNYLPGQDNANPFLNAAIEAAQRPTLQGLEETLARTLPGRFTLAGQQAQPQSSSAFDRAAAVATRGTAQALSDIATNMSFGAYEQERGRQQQAVQLDQAEVDNTIKNLQAQALPRLIEELGIERGIALFSQNTQSILDILKTLAGVTMPTVANNQQSTGESFGGVVPGLAGFFRSGK